MHASNSACFVQTIPRFETAKRRPLISISPTHRPYNISRKRIAASIREPHFSTEDPSRPTTHLISFLTGFVASTIGSLIGAGGGVVLTPILTALSLTQHQAHGTSLCVITVTAFISALKYASGGQIDLFAAAVLSSGAIFTSSIGARASARVNARKLKRYFGVFLILVSALIPVLPFIVQNGAILVLNRLQQRVLLVMVGMVTGFLSGLLGIGGGTINVPVLVLFGAFPQKLAQGTALLAMLIPSMRASMTHIRLKHVVLHLLPGLTAGAVLGAFTGSSTALYLPERALRGMCCFIFASIGVKYMR